MIRPALLLLFVLVPTSLCLADSASVRRDIQRQQAAVKARQEQLRRKQAAFKRQMQATRSRPAPRPVHHHHSRRRTSRSAENAGQDASNLAARMATAPHPARSLQTFIKAVKQAQSMQQIVPLLANHRQENYQRQLASYDAKAAMKRRAELKREGRLDEDLIIRMTEHPYAGELEKLRKMTARYYGVKSFKITGNKAKISAYSHPKDVKLSNGKRPVAQYGMVFEDGSWRFSDYKFNLTVIR